MIDHLLSSVDHQALFYKVSSLMTPLFVELQTSQGSYQALIIKGAKDSDLLKFCLQFFQTKMLRQFLIFALVLSMTSMALSTSHICFTRCMACVMIGDTYCAMDVIYPTGAKHCLKFCHTDQSSLPHGSVYPIINKLRRCRASKDTNGCVRKLFQQIRYGISLQNKRPNLKELTRN